MLGRDMADDGSSARPTVGTAETCDRRNGRDGTRRDPAPDDSVHADPEGTRSGDVRHATTLADPAPIRWCGCPVVRLSGGAAVRWLSDVLLCSLCSLMFYDVRLCSV